MITGVNVDKDNRDHIELFANIEATLKNVGKNHFNPLRAGKSYIWLVYIWIILHVVFGIYRFYDTYHSSLQYQ